MRKAILYYDGKCQLCSKEMSLLKKLKNSELELTSLWETKIEISHDDLLKVLHLRTASGEWLTGLDASVAAWKYTKIGFILTPLRWPVIRKLADKVYLRWANNRYCKMKKSLKQ